MNNIDMEQASSDVLDVVAGPVREFPIDVLWTCEKLCEKVVEALAPHCLDLGAAIHEKYLEHNPHVLVETPHLAAPFWELPIDEARKDLDIALIYYSSNGEAFPEKLAEETHIQWLRKYREKEGDRPRWRNGIQIDKYWADLPKHKRDADIALAKVYSDIFPLFDERMWKALHLSDGPLFPIYEALHDDDEPFDMDIFNDLLNRDFQYLIKAVLNNMGQM